MKTLAVTECTRITVGEINSTDRVFSIRIILEQVAEKLNVPEEQILGRVLRYITNLVLLDVLERPTDTIPVCDDTPLWVSTKSVNMFEPCSS